MSATSQLDTLIGKLAKLDKTLVEKCAPELAKAVETYLKGTIRAGTDPYGFPWKPKKKGDGKPLANAAAHLTVRAVGTNIISRIGFPESLHHLGKARGKVKRKILFSGNKLPLKLTSAFLAIVQEKLKEALK